MAHPFFQSIASRPTKADYFAGSAYKKLKFSQVFSVFFPSCGFHTNEKLLTWLDVIATGFRFDVRCAHKYMVERVETLFRELWLDPALPENTNAFQFWLYLVFVYWKMIQVECNSNDNIFKFMEVTAFPDVKVIIVGNNPAKNISSSGFAFHGSVCYSSKKILHFLYEECGNGFVNMTSEQLECYYQNCRFDGWINQGVLLLNSHFSFSERGGLSNVWIAMTDFIVESLNARHSNLAFLLLGQEANEKRCLIDVQKHFVMSLNHPAFYANERKPLLSLHWPVMLPFLNLNLYLLITNQRMIDWSNVEDDPDANQNETLIDFEDFLRYVISVSPSEAGCYFRINDDIIVGKNDNGNMVLRHWRGVNVPSWLFKC